MSNPTKKLDQMGIAQTATKTIVATSGLEQIPLTHKPTMKDAEDSAL